MWAENWDFTYWFSSAEPGWARPLWSQLLDSAASSQTENTLAHLVWGKKLEGKASGLYAPGGWSRPTIRCRFIDWMSGLLSLSLGPLDAREGEKSGLLLKPECSLGSPSRWCPVTISRDKFVKKKKKKRHLLWTGNFEEKGNELAPKPGSLYPSLSSAGEQERSERHWSLAKGSLQLMFLESTTAPK